MPHEKKEDTITISLESFEALLDARVKAALDKQADLRDFDADAQKQLDRQRGKNRPPIPEELIACRSPMTGATMTVRAIFSRSTPQGRVVEILDYERPEGWNVHASNGGLFNGPIAWMTDPGPEHNPTQEQYKYRSWVYKTFWAADWAALSGKPVSFLAQWRVEPAAKAAE